MFVLVNLKAYECDPVRVAEQAAAVADDTGVRIGVAPQAAHLERVAATGAETWAQHVSPVEPGSHTGSTLAEAVAEAGAVGTLLNHSERRLRLAAIEESVAAASRVDLETIVCGNTPTQVAAAATFEPSAVAIEPPALIGTGTPVSQADPAIVRDAVAAVAGVDGSVNVFCGAGISSGTDVAAAQELGADGVLLASGVATATDPGSALRDLVSEV